MRICLCLLFCLPFALQGQWSQDLTDLPFTVNHWTVVGQRLIGTGKICTGDSWYSSPSQQMVLIDKQEAPQAFSIAGGEANFLRSTPDGNLLNVSISFANSCYWGIPLYAAARKLNTDGEHLTTLYFSELQYEGKKPCYAFGTSNGKTIIWGESAYDANGNSNPAGEYSTWIEMYDNQAELIWSQFYDHPEGSPDPHVRSAAIGSNRFVLAQTAEYPRLTAYDLEGNLLWDHAYTEYGIEVQKLVISPQDRLYMAGKSLDADENAHLILCELDELGLPIWQQEWPQFGAIRSPFLQTYSNGDLAVSARQKDKAFGQSILYFRTTPEGEPLDSLSYSSSYTDPLLTFNERIDEPIGMFINDQDETHFINFSFENPDNDGKWIQWIVFSSEGVAPPPVYELLPENEPRILEGIYNLLGQPVQPKKDTLLLYRYSDGTVEKRVVLSE